MVALCLPSKAGGPSPAMVGGSLRDHRSVVEATASIIIYFCFDILNYNRISVSPYGEMLLRNKNLPSRKIKIFRATFLRRKAQKCRNY